MTNRRIIARNFRLFSHLDWSPAGVSLLAGPNGSGKTTTLAAFDFLRVLFEAGHEAAFSDAGATAFRKIDVPASEPVVLEIHIADVRWKLRFPMDKLGLQSTFGEELYHGDEPILRLPMFQNEWFLGTTKLPIDSTRCCAKFLWDRQEPAWMQEFVEGLSAIQTFGGFNLARLGAQQPIGSRPRRLAADGSNLWSVLASWKAAPTRFGDRFDWVVNSARKAFPGLFASIEFVDNFPAIYPLHSADPDAVLPPARAASGLLAGLVVLSAVAAAAPGSLLAFDEPENHLHPHAIRRILHSIRERATEQGFTVVITTHSPVVMNEFRDDPENVFVLEARPDEPDAPLPTPILDLHDEDWLAQAKLGSLYDRLEFGSPPVENRPEAETREVGRASEPK